MIFLAIDEIDVPASLLEAIEVAALPVGLKPQAPSLSDSALADEERLTRIHLQAGDE
ncbi:MAG TPA: hypothetical protein VHX44_05905 [Planctomycetota bacterium]|jgi:hypothetical protein|nr:hypothetical protein [Planctomycetota bacterium]